MGRGLEKWGLLAVLSLGWGSAFLFQDQAVAEFPPLTVTSLRLLIAAGLLFLAMRASGRRLPRARRPWLFFAALGFIGNLVPFTLITWAQSDVKSSIAGILSAVVPLITLVLAHYFANERITLRRLAGMAVGFGGVVVLFGPELAEGVDLSGGALLSYGAILAGAFCFAVNAVIAARMPRLSPLVEATGVLIAAAVMTAPVALLMEGVHPPRPTLDAVGSIAVLALVITPWATYAYFRLVAVAGPIFLSLFNYFNPLVAVACGVLILNEHLQATALLGLALILAGVAVSEFGRLAAAAQRALAG